MENKELILLLQQISKNELIELLHDSISEIKNLKTEIIQNQPKIEFYEAVTSTDDLTEMSAVAKILNFKGMGRNNLFEFLRNKEILRYNNEPYQEYVDRLYFKVIEQKVSMPYGDMMISYKTMATQKGMDFIRNLLLETGHEYNKR